MPLYKFCCLMIGLTACLSLPAQQKISWEVLADVRFHEQFDEELQAYWMIPTFGDRPRAYEGKEVILSGYFIPVDILDNFFVLSKNPYSSCFFCGGAGPETVVEMQLSQAEGRSLHNDQRITVRGQLQLNKDDFDHCNYILEDAELVKKAP